MYLLISEGRRIFKKFCPDRRENTDKISTLIMLVLFLKKLIWKVK